MTEFQSPEAWIEAAFRNAAFFAITSFQSVGGRRIVRKAQTKNWTEARKCATVLGMRNRTCTIYVISKDNNSAFLPPSSFERLDQIWSEQHGDENLSARKER